MRLKLMLSVQQLYELYHTSGTPAKQVAERLGIKREYLYRVLKRYGIPTKLKLRNEAVNIPESPRDLNDFCNVGIYDGDGYKANKYHIEFSNANIKLVVGIIEWLESFGIPRAFLHFRLKTPDFSNYSQKLSRLCRLLKVYEKQFWKPSKIRGISDVVSVVFSSRYAFERLKTLRENARMQITDVHKAAAYLQGAFAAEGDIYVDKKNRCLIQLSYNAYGERYLREVYEKCLNLLGVKYSILERGSSGKIRICYRGDIEKLNRFSVFSLHHNAFLVNRYINLRKQMQVRKGKAEKEILEACLKLKTEGQPITSEKVSKIIARSRDWSHELLSRMVKKGVLTFI